MAEKIQFLRKLLMSIIFLRTATTYYRCYVANISWRIQM